MFIQSFGLGFNCGEAANIATPEWLRVAKEAAIRRAAINCPPMVSHFQLLYDLALSLSSRFVFSLYENMLCFSLGVVSSKFIVLLALLFFTFLKVIQVLCSRMH